MFLTFCVWQMAVFLYWERLGRLRPQASLRHWLLLLMTILTVLMAHSLYLALVVVGFQGIYLLIDRMLRRRQRLDAAWFLVAPAVMMASLIPMMGRVGTHTARGTYMQFQGLSWNWFSDLNGGFLLPISELPGGLAATAALIIWGLFGLARKRPGPALYLFVSCQIGAYLLLIFYILIDRIYVGRYSIFGFPGMLVLFSMGLYSVIRLLKPFASIQNLLAGFLIIYAAGGVYWFHGVKHDTWDWRGVCRQIAEEAGLEDHVVVAGTTEAICVRYYLSRFERENLPVILSGDEAPAGEGDSWIIHMTFQMDAYEEFTGLRLERRPAGIPSIPWEQMRAELGEEPALHFYEGPELLFGKGWSDRDDWGEMKPRWAISKQAVVYLPLAPEEVGAGILETEIYPYTSENSEPQSVFVQVGDHRTEIIHFGKGEGKTIRWEIPAGAMISGYNPVEFHFSAIRRPSSDKPGYGDFRALSAAVDRLVWEIAD